MNLIPNTRDYLEKFVRAKLEDYREIKKEYRPDNGYGHFHRSDEIYQMILDIYFNLEDNFSYLSIPEKHASPQALIKKIEWFLKLLKSRQELVDDIIKHHQSRNLFLPTPVVEIDKVRREVIDAFEYALTISQSELNPVSKESNAKTIKPQPQIFKWYKKGVNQAAIIAGLFLIATASISVFAPQWFKSENKNIPAKENKSTITLYGDITSEMRDTIGPVDRGHAPLHVRVKGAVSNAMNYYVYIIVNDDIAEWIEPVTGLGARVDGYFSGDCFLGKSNDKAYLNKLYKVYAVVTDREYQNFSILDRKTIITKSNEIELFRTK
ncbi:MAG: hypothetical protein NTX44_11260 [Ignavibacteriales bacterium]|nr:hypothetical protein [Ignavibacteriales bacterium]